MVAARDALPVPTIRRGQASARNRHSSPADLYDDEVDDIASRWTRLITSIPIDRETAGPILALWNSILWRLRDHHHAKLGL